MTLFDKTGAAALAVVGIAASSIAASVPAPAPTRVLVSVTDAAGAPVTGLQSQDFVVRVDGVDAPIVSATVETEPPSIVVIPNGFSRPLIAEARGLLRAVIASAQADFVGARVGLMVRDGAGAPVMHDAVAGADALEREVARFFEHTHAPLLDSLLVASETLARESSTRRVIIVVAVGGSSNVDGLVPSRIARAVRQSGASLWVVDAAHGRPVGSGDGQVLAHVPIVSGGRRVSASLATVVSRTRQTMAVIGSQYVVTYESTQPPGTTPPRIGVRRDDVTVLAPSWPELPE
jgi:hypothetical protein